MRYSLPFENVATSAVADTIKTLAALIGNVTLAGTRARIRALTIGFADDGPADRNVNLRLQRTNNASAGTAGTSVTAANMPQKDTGSIISLLAGAANYSVEPTTFEANPIWSDELNDRNGLIKEWDPDEAPKIIGIQTMCLRAAPRAAFVSSLSGAIEFELY